MRRSPGNRKRRTLLVQTIASTLLFWAALHPPFCSAQQAARPSESQVKAAYLYNFAKFVRWQGNAATADSFDICVIGKNPFGPVLDSTVAGESIAGKSIAARNILTIQEAGQCKVLFISSSEETRLKSILGSTRNLNALTVSDISGFAERGGMIEFVTRENRIRFVVNVTPMGDAGLTVSSELLKVATKVIGVNPAGEIDK